MPGISVHIARESHYWRIGFNVDSNIEPTHVVGCREGCLPVIAGLLAAEANEHAVWSGADVDAINLQTVITVSMPSGRVLTFRQVFVENRQSERPEGGA
jgi:hypothetical protein